MVSKQSEANVRGTSKCPYYYLKLEESLRELDPDTDLVIIIMSLLVDLKMKKTAC